MASLAVIRRHVALEGVEMRKIVNSPVGKILMAANAEGLTHLLFAEHLRVPPPDGDGSAEADKILSATEKQLAEYFAGRRRFFDLPLSPQGTEFQTEVWLALRRIPFGETVSYQALARNIGRPKAVRAVGAANGANPISIVVPCHRVIGKNGRLTGFGGGLQAKADLLKLEGLDLV